MTNTALPRPSWLMVLLFFATIQSALAQSGDNEKNFDSIYFYTATTLSAQNIQQAIVKADSLLNYSQDSLQKVRSMMLLATLHNRTGNYAQALMFAVNGEKLADKISNKEWQIRIAGFLSTTFRDLGLIAEGKKYITVAERLNKQVGEPPLTQMYIHQEKAYYEIDNNNYSKALEEIIRATSLLEAIPEGKGNPIFAASCYQVMGLCYMKLGRFSQADLCLNKALRFFAGQESELKGYIYQNKGELALKQNQYALAIQYLDTALQYTATSDNFNLKASTYESLKDYYVVQGDNKKAIEFQALYIELVEKHTALAKTVSSELIEKFNVKLAMSTRHSHTLYYICGALILLIVLLIVYSIWIRKNQRKKYLAYISKLQSSLVPASLHLTGQLDGKRNVDYSEVNHVHGEDDFSREVTHEEALPEQNITIAFEEPLAKDKGKKVGFGIAKETECRVLEDLNRMEQELFFLQRDMTLPVLAAALKINHKYLSSIINRHKGKDFNNYINELRINYIIRKLQDNPTYQDYKIAYLSEECGFSTHSKFATAFKSLTGLSPSRFINNLKTDRS